MNRFPNRKLKYIAPQINTKLPYEEVSLPYIGLESVQSWTGRVDIDDGASPEGIVSVFEPGDILFGKLRPYLAKVALPFSHGVCSTVTGHEKISINGHEKSSTCKW